MTCGVWESFGETLVLLVARDESSARVSTTRSKGRIEQEKRRNGGTEEGRQEGFRLIITDTC